MTDPAFDTAAAHRHFSAQCFNKAWEYIEKPERTADDDEQMLLCALSSLWHWTQREDCGDLQRSIGHWQISRICCLLGKRTDALHHAERCLHFSESLPPFYQAYGQEAFARIYAAAAQPDMPAVLEHLAKARALLPEIADENERRMVEADLATITGWESNQPAR
jgi:tetratricopeptide (TPR) repeat protein